MPPEVMDVKKQVKDIATTLGVEEAVASALAEKCYSEVAMWRPWGGATSFGDIDSKKKADVYSYAVEDLTYQLRGIVENITSSDELGAADVKESAIKQAATDYRTRVDALNLDNAGDKTWVEKLKALIGFEVEETKTIKKEDGKWVLYTKDGKRKLGTHDTRAEAVAQEQAIEANKKTFIDVSQLTGDEKVRLEAVAQLTGVITGQMPAKAFKIFEDAEGNKRWMSVSSNAFEDLEKELFTTEALEEAVDHGDKTGERGPLLVYHVPSAEIGQCDFQAVAGRFLIESGTFDDTPLGAKALEYFENSDEEHQVSIGFTYRAGDEEDGVYDWLRIGERSVCPFGTAANPWTDFKLIGDGPMQANKVEVMNKIFGSDLAALVISRAEDATKELEQNVRFKATDAEDKKKDEEDMSEEDMAKKKPMMKKEAEDAVADTGTADSEGTVAVSDAKAVVVATGDDAKEATFGPEQLQELAGHIATLTAAIEVLPTMAKALADLQANVKELQASDDEKQANVHEPRWTLPGLNRPTEKDSNVIDTEKVKALLGTDDKENEVAPNPAGAYVRDLLGIPS